jgi:septum formation protein
MRKIILASQSPRRRELLAGMGLQFEIIPSNFDEHLDDSRSPEVVAIELAIGKASDVAEKFPDCLVIGSDTIVTINGNQLEKPHDKVEATQMLKRLSGTYNEVTTSLAVMRKADNVILTSADTTRVYFKPYNAEAVATYVESGDPLDKAGAYGIQSGAAVLIDHIEGYYDTVVGLPTHKLVSLLTQLRIVAEPVELESPVPRKMSQQFYSDL